MEISEVKVFPIQEEKLKAFVSIVFDQCFMVNDIKIIQGRDGLFISMPSRKKKNGEFKDVAHPLNNETRRMIELKVLGEYERVLDERGERLPVAEPPAAGAPVAAVAAASSPNTRPGLAALAGAPLGSVAPVASVVAPVVQAPAVSPAAGGGGDGAAPPGVTTGPADPAAPAAAQEAAGAETLRSMPEKTLEEIEEMHLRDSFWTGT